MIQVMLPKGWVKAENFRHSPRKARYLYRLTPRGLEKKAHVTARFLKQKLREIEGLQDNPAIARIRNLRLAAFL